MRYLEKRGSMNDRIDIVLNKFRSRLSSFPPGLCPLALYRSILQMSMNQSCGKCIPCRDSLREFPDEYESHIRARRCVEPAKQTVPCMTLCPAHVDVPAYIALLREGDCAGAIRMIRDGR